MSWSMLLHCCLSCCTKQRRWISWLPEVLPSERVATLCPCKMGTSITGNTTSVHVKLLWLLVLPKKLIKQNNMQDFLILLTQYEISFPMLSTVSQWTNTSLQKCPTFLKETFQMQVLLLAKNGSQIEPQWRLKICWKFEAAPSIRCCKKSIAKKTHSIWHVPLDTW